MGKWNRRYYPRSNRRSRYQDYDWSPPRETFRDPELGVWQDNVPMWEKKFCFLSGVPWEKVLSTNKFMHCQSNIVEWDDTAGKEAFHNAKECYWAKLNGRQCEIHTPDPDAYIGEIDWNPYIDPDLIEDLDRTFFDDNKFNSLGSYKDPSGRLDKSDDPWGSDHAQSSEALKDKAVGWNQRDDSVDTPEEPTKNSNPWECHDRRDSATTKLDDKDNPWEHGHAQTSQVSKEKATVWNQWDASVDAEGKPANDGNSWDYHEKWDRGMTKFDNNNPWQRGHIQTTSETLKNKSAGWIQSDDRVNATQKRTNNSNSWGYHDRPGTATNNYGSRDRIPQSYLNKGNSLIDDGNKWRSGNRRQDFGESSWGHNQCETGISKSSYHNGGDSRDRKNDWGWKPCGQYGSQRRGGFVEERGRKREGPGQNMPGYKGAKLHYTDESSRRWNNGSNDKRGRRSKIKINAIR
ncbi:hypothetical protein V2J09_017531 [Rumex salicifolius]